MSALSLYLQREKLKEPWTGKGRYGLFLLLFLPNLAIALYFILTNFRLDSAFLIPLAVTLLVGIAEELMFRRVLFIGLLKEMPFSKALVLSSIVFSLLHSVNVFAGLPVQAMLMQLVSTFLAGLFYALMYWYTKSICLMIASHWLWDYVLLGGATTQVPAFGAVMLAMTVLQLAVTAYLRFKIIGKDEPQA